VILIRPDGARWLYVLAHGAGAGMRHPFMTSVAEALAARAVATLRWELPYMAAGRRRPDRPEVCVDAVRAALAEARARAPDLRLCAGGKSFGGRMTSTALADRAEPGVEAVVFLGFPLHPAGKPDTRRASHLTDLSIPTLFVQGSRDALADPALLGATIAGLGGRATLHEVAGADHGFAVPRRSGDAIAAIADAVAEWLGRLDSSSRG
jgi:uncharacterized protein